MNDIDSAVETIASLPTLATAGNLARKLAGKKESLDQLAQAAKDFESVLLVRLLAEMKRTIPEGGLLTDPTCKQMNDLFWYYLGQDLAEKGGMGLTDDLYRQMSQMVGDMPVNQTMEQLL